VRIVHEWLVEMVDVPKDVETVAREISLRGFEVASVERGVIDFEVTANRPDCLNHLGIAREASVIWETPLKLPRAQHGDKGPAIPVRIEAPDLCPRYAAQLFEVRVGPSPDWLVRRLEAAGVRPINNVVDVTNYVMLEIGQPMHAFDLDRLAGPALVIRRARANETLRTLDGVERALDEEMLVIADEARAVAIGGVMGGLDSEINGTTTRMVLESACFTATSVRRTSKRLGLKTEASTRFERGADITGAVNGLARASALLQQIGAATPGLMVDAYPAPSPAAEIVLRASRIPRVLGMDVPADGVARILEGLGFAVRLRDDGAWVVEVPTFRVDVTREIDLVEEVGRHHGFDKLPTTFPVLTQAPVPADSVIDRDRRVRSILTAAGLSESMTFAFIERTAAEPFCQDGFEPAALANPLSEKFAVLRPSLLPGLIDSAAHNRRRGRKDVRLFELGRRFTSVGESRAVAMVWTGGTGAHWSSPSRGTDFFDIKGAVDLLLGELGVRRSGATPARDEAIEYAPAAVAYLTAGRAAVARAGAIEVAVLGQLDGRIAERRGFPAGEEVYVAEIDLDAARAAAADAELRTETLPRFPAIVRDVSILVDEALPAAVVRGTIRSAAPESLVAIVEFDRYQGKGVPEGRVSLSLRLTFRSLDRTLTDAEIEAAMTTIVSALEREHGAHQR
jgi:phenylalanyl-tRNA synthetase beta chain